MERAQEIDVKPLGAVRKIDPHGRITIPAEILKLNGWTEGMPLQIFAAQSGGLYLRKYGEGSQKEQLIEQLMTIADNVASKEIQNVVNKTISYLRTEG
ncbi:AbrB/MazE/SpoVT family DNA-binding domain-containing protein [Bacillus infantis]|uniref:AbrB/MazE/SpoVT family DNA-binding domain-containing protein n=1 Tax=Bacillus infantis TaxID=324767 RepID=UPI00398267A1